MHYFDSFTRPGLEPRTIRSEIKIVAPLQWNIEMTISGAQEQADPDNGSSSHHFVPNNKCFNAVTFIGTGHPWIIMAFCSAGFDHSSDRKISERLFPELIMCICTITTPGLFTLLKKTRICILEVLKCM